MFTEESRSSAVVPVSALPELDQELVVEGYALDNDSQEPGEGEQKAEDQFVFRPGLPAKKTIPQQKVRPFPLPHQEGMEKELPTSSETIIKTLLFLLRDVRASSEMPNETKDTPVTISASEVKTNWDILEAQLNRENLIDEDIAMGRIVEDIKRCMAVNDWKTLQDKLLVLQRMVQPFDVDEMLSLIEKTNFAAKSLEGQDVVLLLGRTGAGKSTTVHFLAGSRMERTTVSGLEHIQATEIKNRSLDTVSVSPFAKSETRYISAVPLNAGMSQSGNVVLCDTPGFEDTNGPEVDIANSVGVANAVKKAKSVRPVVLISQKSMGDRGELIKSMAYLLSRMMANFNQHLDAVTYIFTKYSDKDRAGIHPFLKNCAEHLTAEDKADETLIAFYEAILESTEQSVNILDPTKDDPKKLLKSLVRVSAIQHPDEVFQSTITDKSLQALNDQVSKYKSSIPSAARRGDYALVHHRLEQLKLLMSTLDKPYIQKAYHDCIREVNVHLNGLYNEIQQLFEQAFDDANTMGQKEKDRYIAILRDFTLSASLREAHLGREAISLDALMQLLIRKSSALLEDLEDFSIDDPIVKKRLDKLALLSTLFVDESLYKAAQDICRQKIDHLIAQARMSLESNAFDEFSLTLKTINHAVGLVNPHLQLEYLANICDTLLEALKKHLNNLSDTATAPLSADPERLTAFELEMLTKTSLTLVAADTVVSLKSFFTKDAIRPIYDAYLNKIFIYFQALERKINEIYDKERELGFEKIEALFNLMSALQKISGLEPVVANVYFSTIERLCGFVKELKREAEAQLAKFLQEENQGDCQKLSKCIASLKKIRWLEKHRPGICEETFQEIQREVVSYVRNLIEGAKQRPFQLEQYREVKVLYDLVLRIKNLAPLDAAIPELNSVREELIDWFALQYRRNFREIRVFAQEEKAPVETSGLKEQCEQVKRKMHQTLSACEADFLGRNKIQSVDKLRTVCSTVLTKNAEMKKGSDAKDSELERLVAQMAKLQAIQKECSEIPRRERVSGSGISKRKKFLSDKGYQSSQHLDEQIRAFAKIKQDLEHKITVIKAECSALTREGDRARTLLAEYEETAARIKTDADVEIAQLLKEAGFQNIAELEALRLRNATINQHEEKQREIQLNLVEPEKAQLICIYLKSCADIVFLRDEWETTNAIFMKFSKRYGELFLHRMQSHFGALCSDQEPQQEAQSLLRLYRKLLLMSDKYSEFFTIAYPAEILTQWQSTLQEYLSELTDEMMQLNTARSTLELKKKLRITKALIPFDSFIERGKFFELYSSNRQNFMVQTVVTPEVFLAIREHRYPYIASELARFTAINDESTKHSVAQIQDALTRSLNDFIDETKILAIMMGADINAEGVKNVRSIVDSLQKMKEANQLIGKYLDEACVMHLRECSDFVKKSVAEQMMKFLATIEAAVDANDFYESDVRIGFAKQARDLLAGYCAPGVVERINEIEMRLGGVLDEVIKRYVEASVSQYHVYPPKDIFEKFRQVVSKDQRYLRALQRIKDGIFEKCRKELDDARQSPKPFARNTHIRSIQIAIRFLPDELRVPLEHELAAAKEDIERMINDQDEKVSELLETGNIDQIGVYLQQAKEKQSSVSVTAIKLMQEGILTAVKELRGRIESKLENDDVSAVSGELKKLCHYERVLGKEIPQVDAYYRQVRQRIGVSFDRLQRGVLTALSADQEDFSLAENGTTLANAERCFLLLGSFVDTEKEVSPSVFLENKDEAAVDVQPAIYPDHYKTALNELFERIVGHFNKIYEKYHLGIERADFRSLAFVLDKLKKWDNFLRGFKKYVDNHPPSSPEIGKQMNTLANNERYEVIVRNLIDRIALTQKFVMSIELINEETAGLEVNRRQFYQKLNDSLSLLWNVKELSSHLRPRLDVEKMQKEILTAMQEKLGGISHAIKTILTKSTRSRADYDAFNRAHQNLVTIGEFMPVLKDIPQLKIRQELASIDEFVMSKVKNLIEKAAANPDVDEFAKLLIEVKTYAESMFAFKERIDAQIDLILNDFKRKDSRNGGKNLAKLGTILNTEVSGIGQTILAEHKCFVGYSIYLFNAKTRAHGIEHVLSNLEGDSLDKSKLEKRYAVFTRKYDDLLKKYLKESIDFDRLEGEIRACVAQIKFRLDKPTFSAQVKDQLPDLIAAIFVLWTLKHSAHYFDAKEVENSESYLMRPHAAQVIAIFRMLGIDEKGNVLVNNLVQIGTGEGKSVTLAVTATVLALLGFDVSCACYSQYLSERDYQDFQPMFEALRIDSLIHYGTFNNLCEAAINEEADIRSVVKDIISGEAKAGDIATVPSDKRPKILLIDEVDVFFSRDFYGNVYTPSTTLTDPTIHALIDFIWTKKSASLHLVKNSPQYKAVCTRFAGWEFLIEEAVKDMLVDLKTYEKHDYFVVDDKIGYKEQDGINFNLSFGYKTLFAYYLEHERGQISDESLRANIGITIQCGNFSYAEIPHKFKAIMGVTGTLKTLSATERRIIQSEYKLDKKTFMPSVFGQNNLVFGKEKDIKIENAADFHNALRREIDVQLAGRVGGQRAVLVFFDTKEKLMAFRNAPCMTGLKGDLQIMTEEVNTREKLSIIKRATNAGQVTLLTRAFGRGTDFVCRDQTVSNNGGAHVLQTFLSAQASEETQIKGRTARQGDFGSYSMVLYDKDLECFQITPADLEKAKADGSLHTLLHEKRNKFFELTYAEHTKFIDKIQEEHQIAMRFIESLRSIDRDFIRAFLGQRNKGATAANRSRTICLMDATGSMSHLIQKAKNTVGTVFQRASQILTEKGVAADAFEVQFAVYRNYDCKAPKLLQVSSWETKPDNLRAFMDTVAAEGGTWAPEAVEIGLWHANQEANDGGVDQVILIGDAPANTPELVERGRTKYHGEAYWQKTKFAEKTEYRKEIELLRQKGVRVHGFFVANAAKVDFVEIARQTNGRSEFLDVNSPSGGDALTDLVAEEVLRSVGGSENGAALVAAYQSKYAKSYR